jgi:hypothetical protein
MNLDRIRRSMVVGVGAGVVGWSLRWGPCSVVDWGQAVTVVATDSRIPMYRICQCIGWLLLLGTQDRFVVFK